MRLCKIKNCNNKHNAKGYCKKHYLRFWLYGDPLAKRKMIKKKGKIFKCEYCAKSFYRTPSEIKRGRQRFCSKQCAGKKMKGELKNTPPIENSNWRINRKGYVETTRRKKRILQHRWIMEQYIGRELTIKEAVHHLNGKKTDNRLENLIVLSTTLHSKKHRSAIKENKIMRQLLVNICREPHNVNWLKNVKWFLKEGRRDRIVKD